MDMVPPTVSPTKHHFVVTSQKRNPGIPKPAALGVSVVKNHRFGPLPRISEVVDIIVHIKVVCDPSEGHAFLLFFVPVRNSV
jgi:hypothetical protein